MEGLLHFVFDSVSVSVCLSVSAYWTDSNPIVVGYLESEVSEIRCNGRYNYRQVIVKVNEYHICQQGYITSDNTSVLVFRSSSYVTCHRRGGVCVLWMILVL